MSGLFNFEKKKKQKGKKKVTGGSVTLYAEGKNGRLVEVESLYITIIFRKRHSK